MFILEVLSGQQAGAKVELDALPAKVGGSLDNDIVIRELGDNQVVLSEGKFGNLVATSSSLDVKLTDGRSVNDAKARDSILFPAILHLNEVISISVSTSAKRSEREYQVRKLLDKLPVETPDYMVNVAAKATDQVAPAETGNMGLLRVAGVGAAAVILLFFSFGDLARTELRTEAPSQTLMDSFTPGLPNSATAAPQQSADCPECVAKARDFLQGLLRENNINGLMVGSDSNVLKVDGEIVTSQKSIWAEVHQKYDLAWNAFVPLETNISEVEEIAPFKVSSVWLGDVPELTTSDGDTYRVEDLTASGWRIKAIEQSKITLARSSSELVIEF